MNCLKSSDCVFLIFGQEGALCLSETNKLAGTPTFHSDFQVWKWQVLQVPCKFYPLQSLSPLSISENTTVDLKRACTFAGLNLRTCCSVKNSRSVVRPLQRTKNNHRNHVQHELIQFENCLQMMECHQENICFLIWQMHPGTPTNMAWAFAS